jgi:hypothetical protein
MTSAEALEPAVAAHHAATQHARQERQWSSRKLVASKQSIARGVPEVVVQSSVEAEAEGLGRVRGTPPRTAHQAAPPAAP